MGSDSLPPCKDGLLFIDLETFNPLHDLKKVGTDVYARDAEIILASYGFTDGPVHLWEYGQDNRPLLTLLRRPDVKIRVAHNAYFEQSILRHTQWLPAHPKHWHCTMAQAYAHAMPGELEALCRYLDVPLTERKKGNKTKLINLFCKPQKNGQRLTAEDRPDEWEEFKQYALHDTIALRAVFARLPQLNLSPLKDNAERRLWVLDQQINFRGMAVDLGLAQAASTACAREKKRLDAVVSKITKGVITSATQRERVLKHLNAAGVDIPDVRAATIAGALNDTDLRGEVRQLIEARQLVSKASTGKFNKLLSHTGPDGRLRGCIQFAGAKRTGRWAGRTFQPHNMPRPKRKHEAILLGIAALKAGCEELLDDTHAICSDVLRSLVVAKPGHLLRVADYNAIEGRKLAWLAGEHWKLDVYRDPGADMYISTYRRVMGLKPTADVSSDQRQHGKVFELSYGYEGGVDASLNGCKAYGINPKELGEGAWRAAPPAIREKAMGSYEFARAQGSEETQAQIAKLGKRTYVQLEAAKHMWRESAPATRALWKGYQTAAIRALAKPGMKFAVCKCIFLYKGNFLYCRLPSGRFLMYADPRVHKDKNTGRSSLSYLADYGGRQWMYGGKWAENITQAVARDRLAYSMLNVADAGFPIVLHVHDEIVAETEADGPLDLAKMIDLMEINPPWASDCPIRLSGYEADRYRKD